MPHTCGGSVRLVKVIDEVHKLVNEHRISIGLAKIQFEDRIGDTMNDEDKVIKVERPYDWPPPPEPIYKIDEINLALSKGGSIRVTVNAGDKKVKCACNCGGYLPVSTVMQGWKYLHGHKNPDALTKGGRLKNGSSNAKPVIKSEVYDTFISRIKMDKANVEHEMKAINIEATMLMAKLKELKEEFNRLDNAEKALQVFSTDKSMSAGA
jgi:hypothetical protein